MGRSVIVEMPYTGKELSVNHYLGRTRRGGVYVKGEVLKWKEVLGWQIKTSHIEDWNLPLTVMCDGQFSDKRSQPDLSNLSKIILDAIEESCGVNDRNMRWQDGVSTIDKEEEPMLLITIKEVE